MNEISRGSRDFRYVVITPVRDEVRYIGHTIASMQAQSVLPLQWMLKRPWTIVAKTLESADTTGEHWVGTVNGMMSARQDTRQVVENLKVRAIPDDGTGILRQLT